MGYQTCVCFLENTVFQITNEVLPGAEVETFPVSGRNGHLRVDIQGNMTERFISDRSEAGNGYLSPVVEG